MNYQSNSVWIVSCSDLINLNQTIKANLLNQTHLLEHPLNKNPSFMSTFPSPNIKPICWITQAKQQTNSTKILANPSSPSSPWLVRTQNPNPKTTPTSLSSRSKRRRSQGIVALSGSSGGGKHNDSKRRSQRRLSLVWFGCNRLRRPWWFSQMARWLGSKRRMSWELWPWWFNWRGEREWSNKEKRGCG